LRSDYLFPLVHRRRRHQSIKLGLVRNATITGVTSLDSKFFHVTVVGSHDVAIHRVSIRAPRSSPNTDGVHIQGSSNVRVTDSAVATGDDCVSVGPGASDVVVSGVSCGPGHGISVGSLGRYPGEEDVRRLRVANCTLAGTSNGVRIKTWRGGTWPTAVTGLVFEDIVMRKVHNPIIIDQEYCPYASCRESVRRSMQSNCWIYGLFICITKRSSLDRVFDRRRACRSSGRRR